MSSQKFGHFCRHACFTDVGKKNGFDDQIPFRGIIHGKRGSFVREVFLPNDVCDAGLR
jgi:hypothetical protein